MIHFIHEPKRSCHTDRSYLNQWFFHDVLIITDVDINEEQDLRRLIKHHRCKNVLVDLSHNAMPWHDLPDFLKQYPILSTMFDDWYGTSGQRVYYFPLWLWMFSSRSNQFFSNVIFDAPGTKSLPMMCLNRNLQPHRVRFRELIQPVINKIVYTYGPPGLDQDRVGQNGMVEIDISVGHRVYGQCAVNVVTETVMDRPSLSEKSCKPFVARQIPIIVGPQRSNKFLTDLGLDMFADIVPWQTWDDDPDEESRLQKISAFVISWINQGTILDDYRRVQHRVEQNKQYFHSDAFRSVILKHMPTPDPFKL